MLDGCEKKEAGGNYNENIEGPQSEWIKVNRNEKRSIDSYNDLNLVLGDLFPYLGIPPSSKGKPNVDDWTRLKICESSSKTLQKHKEAAARFSTTLHFYHFLAGDSLSAKE